MIIAKLNRRSSLFLLLPALVLTFSCKDMKLDIQDLEDRLDVLEGTKITSINDQISSINKSVSDLQKIDETLDAYIKALETAATDLQQQIDDANAEIAKVESELGEEIPDYGQSILNELTIAKESIEAELLAINNTLAELKQADEALDKKISDLQTYVDTRLTSITDWADATFSTLTQYEQTQTEISLIKALIEQINAGITALEARLNGKIAADIQTAMDLLRSELSTDSIARIESAVAAVTKAYADAICSANEEITKAYTTAIATAISECEASLKVWISEKLANGYYDIAAIDGKLSALSARLDENDTDLQKQINEQKTALATLKEELTKAYKSAIKDAVEENNGVINASIASAVKEVEDKLQEEIDAVNHMIEDIVGSLAELKEAFVNRIQSLKFIPEFSDRKVSFSEVAGAVLDFMVSPMNQAAALADAWNRDNSIVKAFLRYTSAPVTRAVCEPIELSVVSVTSDGKGDISVVVKEDPANPLTDEFWNESQDAVVYLRISDGSNDIISELIDAVGYIPPPLSLGESEAANSYIVSQKGNYKFSTVKGNSGESVGAVASAEVLWESFGTDVTPNVGDLVKNAVYSDGYITFHTAEIFKEGNAVIAAKDASGNILWSWHIWLTDEPEGQVYYNNAGTMMDRNLGATSVTPGDVCALGLMYQWGRKDPFLGSSSGRANVTARSTAVWPAAVFSNSKYGTVDYSISHPTTFIAYNDKNNDWYYTGDSSTDNSRWTTSETKKSIYDPCPAGWRVPDGGLEGVWAKAFGSSQFMIEYSYDRTNNGIDFSSILGADQTIWYPATGMLIPDNDDSYKAGHIYDVGEECDCWSSSPDEYDSSAYQLYFNLWGYTYPRDTFMRSIGQSVRCIKE